jgi:hypothetical protein
MKYMNDIPLAIATPLLVPVKGLETDWFFSSPRDFTDFEASVESSLIFHRTTLEKRCSTEATIK